MDYPSQYDRLHLFQLLVIKKNEKSSFIGYHVSVLSYYETMFSVLDKRQKFKLRPSLLNHLFEFLEEKTEKTKLGGLLL